MVRRWLFLAAVSLLPACSTMEQYHFPQTQDKVPAEVMVGLSEAYPNDSIVDVTEQKMYDGTTRYTFTLSNPKKTNHTASFSKDGKPI